MASYISKVLTPNEKLIYQARLSKWHLAPLIFLGIILLFAAGVGIIFLIAAYIKYISTELVITDKRVIAKFGFISRRTVEINIRRIESIQVEQGLFGRIFDYGSLVVSGAGNPQAPIPGISNPLAFRNAFVEAQELAALAQPA